jgi:hypothetical protein
VKTAVLRKDRAKLPFIWAAAHAHVRRSEKGIILLNVTFFEGLRNLIFGLTEILWERVKIVVAAILFMTVFAITWGCIAILLGAEVKEVAGVMPFKGFGLNLDYGSPVLWTISCIIALAITVLVSVTIVSFFRTNKSK